jgi:hypothetical protein
MSDKSEPKPGSEMASPLPEVQFALALSRTINALEKDPAQLRHTVYEQARIALWRDIIALDDPEHRDRLARALETAIVGVEKFASHHENLTSRNNPLALNKAAHPAQITSSSGQAVMRYARDISPPLPTALIDVDRLPPAPRRTIVDVSPQYVKAIRKKNIPWIAISGLAAVFILIASAIAIRQPQNWLPKLFGGASQTGATRSADLTWAQTTTLRTPASPEPAASAAVAPKPNFPLPTTYGSFALNDGQLVELSVLEGNVPDKRVAIASPFQTPSRTVLADGSPTFVIFRRDLASIPSDGIEVRVIAHISRTMKFDSSAKSSPNYAAEDDLWSLRGISYKFKAAPVIGYPEVMVVRPESSDTVLPPGRYALVLKRQGFDFTVAGNVTDPSHCLERTEAANGTFYSPCKTP